ncbi:MAG: hypothetical protein K2U26_16105 [Cyclobacteriaceae bacterium]|nr:hypothetical protein [Cyclobacteriaceae bacterium]
MNVVFLKAFEKELAKTKDKKLALSIKGFIELMESSDSLQGIPQIKKLSGHKTAYRIRMGDYRLGFYFSANTITLAALGHRKEIYRRFP